MTTDGRNATIPTDHWHDIARRWQLVGPPLRPAEQDLQFFSNVIERWQPGSNRAPRALVLGVTPELFHLPWPPGTDLRAADHTQAMIDAVWPGPRSAAMCAEWTQLPFADSSRDIVFCDGGVHLLVYPHEHLPWVNELRRIIAPGGYCALRLFIPPSERQTPDVVIRDLLAGHIPSLNILKLKLGMSMQQTAEDGVQLARVWDAIHGIKGDFAQLAAQLGWDLEHLLAINSYRDCSKCYHFLTTAEVSRLFCEEPGGFVLDRIETPTYQLGDQCPTVVLRRY